MDQQKANQVKTNESSSDIKEFFTEFDNAIRQGDLEKITSFYSPQVTAFDMMPPLRFHGLDLYKQKAWKECFTDMFEFPITYDRSEQDITVKDDFAVSHGLIHMSGKFKESGEETNAWLRTTMCLQKKDGRWMVVHEHNSAPSDMDGKVLMDLAPDATAEGFGIH